VCITGDLSYWIQFDPFWIKGQEGKWRKQKYFLNVKILNGLTNIFFLSFSLILQSQSIAVENPVRISPCL
jgi:hypothetical protein